jgi:phytoene dehydrogenase-like protein
VRSREDVRADAIVIGAGFGGLGAALTLAEAGAHVVMLERLNYPGGCASTFERDGYRFESGATLFSGFGEGQLMQRWIERHQLAVEVAWPDPIIELRAPGLTLPIGGSREQLCEEMCAQAGAPKAAIRRFFDRQRRVADLLWPVLDDPDLLPPFSTNSWLHHLKQSPRYLPLLPMVGRSLQRATFDAELMRFEPLRIYLDALCQITVQTSSAEAEALFALSAVDYPFRGTAHVRGGIGQLAWALTGALDALGGRFRPSCAARSIQRDGDAWRVATRHGDVVAPVVVANLLPSALDALVDDDTRLELPRADPREGWGAAMLYLGLDDTRLARSDAHHLQLVADADRAFSEGNHAFVSISADDETDRAPAGQRTATVSTHMALGRLLDLPDERRGDYVAEVQQRMRDTLRQRAPRLADAIVKELTASPRTFERFTGRPHGFVGGVPRRAGLRNYAGMGSAEVAASLHLVGDTVFPGQSTLATAVGGVKTAQQIINRSGRDDRRWHSREFAARPPRALVG